MKIVFDPLIQREDFIPYRDTYNASFIAPLTKLEQNPVFVRIEEKQAIAVMRAMLDFRPEIESDLALILDEQLLARVKGSTTKLVPVEVNYGETIDIGIPEGDEVQSSFVDLYQPDYDELLSGLKMDKRPLVAMTHLINTGKHIIFSGPPGTGKTTLAERSCEQAEKRNFISGYIMTTAVCDWSTFDTIGGYMPDKTGQLVFQEGILLKSIRENKWIIVDEINRAEVDKAFGHFFTVLSGKSVELQYKTFTPSGEQPIKLCQTVQLGSYYDSNSATYFIGQNWRILATMNTYDKNSLFMLSYAFMRRFSFIYIPSLSNEASLALINDLLPDNDALASKLNLINKNAPKRIGTAVILDLIDYLKESGYSGLADGVCSIVIPQFEGITNGQVKQLYQDYGALFSAEEKNRFKDYLNEFFDINNAEFLRVDFNSEDSVSDEQDELRAEE